MKFTIHDINTHMSFDQIKEIAPELYEQIILVAKAENKMHPEALIDNVRKIYQDFINYKTDNSKIPLLPEFEKNLSDIEKVIRNYEKSILKPIIINEENISRDIPKEYPEPTQCFSLRKSGEKIISAAKEIISSNTDELSSEKGLFNNIAAWFYKSTFGNNQKNETTDNNQILQPHDEGFVILNSSPQSFDSLEVKAGGEQ